MNRNRVVMYKQSSGYSLTFANLSLDGLLRTLQTYSVLCKIRISVFATLSASTGFILSGTGINVTFFITVAGVFLLACGASSLNQYQERWTDAKMERTNNRPVPSGEVSAAHALKLSCVLVISGILILSCSGDLRIAGLGMFAVIWYNGFYTVLKKYTAFAALPGALVGAVPPAIGWLAGGATLSDYRLLAVSFFFFIWQVPHFWLLLLANRNDYEKSGMPVMSRIFSFNQMTRLTVVWMTAASVSCLLMPLYGVLNAGISSAALLFVTIWFLHKGFSLFQGKGSSEACRKAFGAINLYMFFIMLVLNTDLLLFT